MATSKPGIPWIITLSFQCLSPSSHGCLLWVYAFTPSILRLIISTRVHYASVWLWLDYYTIKSLLWNKVTFLIAKINFFQITSTMRLDISFITAGFTLFLTKWNKFSKTGLYCHVFHPMSIFPSPPLFPGRVKDNMYVEKRMLASHH